VKTLFQYLSNNLLTAVTIAFVSGIAISSRFILGPTTLNIVGISLLVIITVIFIFQRRKKTETTLYVLLPFVCALACYHTQLHLQLPSEKNHIYNIIQKKLEAVITGTMAQTASFNGTMSQTIIRLETIRFPKDKRWHAVKGNILLKMPGKWPDNILPGDSLAVRTMLKRPHGYMTPGTFDYPQFLARKDIWITGSLRSPLLLHKISKQQTFLHSLIYFHERLRTKTGLYIDSVVCEHQSPLYRAILLGDKSRIKEKTLETFKNCGTMHILAISGLHMAVIGTLLYLSIYRLLSRSEHILLRGNVRKYASFITMPVLIFYAMLAGLNTPVIRSVIMSGIIILAICSDRKKSPAPLLSFAALTMLVADPLQLYTVSFQLSFAATIAILFYFPKISSFFLRQPTLNNKPPTVIRNIFGWGMAGLCVSTIAILATIPISLYVFNRVSLIGPVANLIIEPLICCWALVLGFLAIPCIYFYPDLAAFFLQSGEIGLKYAMHIASFFANLPHSHLWLPTPSVWHIAFYYGTILCLNMPFFPGGNRGRYMTAIPIATSLLLFFFPLNFLQNNRLTLTFLDVGQGSSTLVQFPSGKQALIDCGGSSYPQPTVGRRAIAPFLWYKGIKQLDLVAITHPDADHYNGLNFIAKHFKPQTLWIKNRLGHDKEYRRVIDKLQKKITVTVPSQGQVREYGETILESITNIGKWRNTSFQASDRSRKNSGLVIAVKTPGFSALFPGDISKKYENALVDGKYPIQTDIMLAPHHGSRTSNSERFLTTSSTDFLIVSAAESSKNIFPHKHLKSLCKRHGITMLSTAEQGTIEVVVGEKMYSIYGHNKPGNNPLLSPLRFPITKQPI